MRFALETNWFYQGAWFHGSADSAELPSTYLKYKVCHVFRQEVTNNIMYENVQMIMAPLVLQRGNMPHLGSHMFTHIWILWDLFAGVGKKRAINENSARNENSPYRFSKCMLLIILWTIDQCLFNSFF